nr:DUF262 domain-containing HNH endonuclease family protein [uncultured Massilia sp.]
MSQHVATRIESASLLCAEGAGLVIPSYQRPYVWPVEDVIQLLDDIVAACLAGEEHYYIGTIMSAQAAGTHTGPRQELVDGQQRITTLMLLALAIRKVLPDAPLAAFATLDAEPRLTFRIRTQVQAYLGSAAGLSSYRAPDAEETDKDEYLAHLHRATRAADDAIARLQANKGVALERIAAYIFSSVKWVNNTVPPGVNLNRLFAKINTSGLQLEQSDILKSQLLRKITRNKTRYDAIWQACENMGNYFERNVRKLFPAADWKHIAYADLARFDPLRFDTHADAAVDAATVALRDLVHDAIADLPAGRRPQAQNGPDERSGSAGPHAEAGDDEEDEDKRYCRSIIGFPLLLMHTYRIYLARQDHPVDIATRLHAARFGECFAGFAADATESEACAFIECLWQVRYQFDAWVVKWTASDETDEAVLRLSSVSVANEKGGGKRLSRSLLDTSDLSQLQAVRNFTGERSAQYWLTPMLGLLIRTPASNAATVLRMLEDIDDDLSLAGVTQKEASFALLTRQPFARDDVASVAHMLDTGNKGTRFEHYWFQKLEYILWKRRDVMNFNAGKLARFRITSKNSVEHVHPQNHEYEESIGDLLDAFGNLVLLSPGENSAYSNMDPKKKRVDFDKKQTYDSLKLACMFRSVDDGDWDQGIQSHQQEMIESIVQHYGSRC